MLRGRPRPFSGRQVGARFRHDAVVCALALGHTTARVRVCVCGRPRLPDPIVSGPYFESGPVMADK